MSDIDIDSILEKTEKKEKQKKQKDVLVRAGMIAGAAAAAAVAAIIIVLAVIGETSAPYFPMDGGVKYIYNRKNKSPEEWQFRKKAEMFGDFECRVLDKTNQADYSTMQEYYIREKKGIIRLGISKDMGAKKAGKMRVLPERLKKGLVFDAGSVKNTQIK